MVGVRLRSVCRLRSLTGLTALLVVISTLAYMTLIGISKIEFQSILPVNTRPVQIPKIIHQTFTTRRIFTEYRKYIEHCLKLNPDWEYYLWTDEDIVAFINDHYPYFMRKYLTFKMHVQRGDSIRYMVLHHFGGIYIDMDVECVKPFFPSLENQTAFVDQEAKEHSVILYGMDFSAMNSAMGSVRGHPFFLRLVFAMMEVDDGTEGAGPTTGPTLLTSQLINWWAHNSTRSNEVALLDPPVFSPLIDDALHHFKSKCEAVQKSERLGLLYTWLLFTKSATRTTEATLNRTGHSHFLETFCRPLFLAKCIGEIGEIHALCKKGTPKTGDSAAQQLHQKRLQLCRQYAERNWKHDLSGPETVGRHLFMHLGYRWGNRKPSYFDINEVTKKVKFYRQHKSSMLACNGCLTDS